ncbi:At-hook motif nuclear-localized protein [Thalictrum thalictroides]|uniref:AT-hook motif nuclear-localized protein n=1 Tax=Thalictrum thalictroides TaxID=46969 RepID=A0A7J6WI82_THATH|nr:At-hook motif nuclear-localized protein [Thalictrum thalictroides]
MEGRESTVSVSPTNTESESPPMSGVVPQMMNMAVTSMETNIGGSGMEMLTKKKRGRPRKYGPDGSLALALSPTIFSSSSDFSERRGRGRPPGSGNRQLLASLGEWVLSSAGGNFTPHVVTINTGEDVAAKILSFSQKGPRAICILSANGAVSNVTIRQPGSSGGILTYEGRFEILALSGSFTLSDSGGVRSRTGGLSVSLAGPDGRVIGGGVAGQLMAASPIQVVVGSFMPNSHKSHKRKHQLEPSMPSPIPGAPNLVTAARPISQAIPEYETCATPSSTLPVQSQGEAENVTNNITNINSTSLEDIGWLGTESTSDQKPSPDINLGVPGE